MGGIIVGVIALLIGGYAAITVSKLKTQVAGHDEKITKIDAIENQATTAATDAAKANRDVAQVRKETNDAFQTVGNFLTELRTSVTKLEESQKKPTHVAGGAPKSNEPVVAGPDEYVIKPGDTFSKIGAAMGVKPADISAVNPGVDSSKLHVGQKIKLPKK